MKKCSLWNEACTNHNYYPLIHDLSGTNSGRNHCHDNVSSHPRTPSMQTLPPPPQPFPLDPPRPCSRARSPQARQTPSKWPYHLGCKHWPQFWPLPKCTEFTLTSILINQMSRAVDGWLPCLCPRPSTPLPFPSPSPLRYQHH